MIIKTYGELVSINSSYGVGLQTPRGRNAPLQPRLFQWVSWFKCGAMTDTLAQAVARLFNWQRCGLSLATGAEFCFRVKGNTDPKPLYHLKIACQIEKNDNVDFTKVIFLCCIKNNQKAFVF
ncbi:hypothetical protein GTE46_001438 [Salmonella enterica subsp. enterica]|nr:hypothetical protein [Salmonella enterica subsp. enterica]EDY2800150.1 hypothetical protein [Salmonella enterica subsp. enterica]